MLRGLWTGLLLTAALLLCAAMGWQAYSGADPARLALLHVALVIVVAIAVRGWRLGRGPAVVFAVAIVARLCFLPLEPANEVHRYLWDGSIQSAGLDPYTVAPGDAATLTYLDENWAKMDDRDELASRPPGGLLALRALAAVSRNAFLAKAVVTLIDLAAIAVLLALLKAVKRRPHWALLYALNPVVLWAFAGRGHLDAAVVLLALVALLCHQRGHWARMHLAIAAAVHVDLVAVALLPFLLRRESLRQAWLLVVAVALPFAFLRPSSAAVADWLQAVGSAGANGSAHPLLVVATNSPAVATGIGVVITAAIVLFRRLGSREPLGGAAIALTVALLVSPTVSFQRLAWILPFLCFGRAPAILLWSATIAVAYGGMSHAALYGAWQQPLQATAVEYVPVYALLLYRLLRPSVAKRIADGEPIALAQTVSVVVPTLNEEDAWPAFAANLQRMTPPPFEIIVSDGGSTDGTIALARGDGARVVTSPTGRGRQIKRGIDVATGDVILIAHADMRLADDALARICAALDRSGQPGGCLGNRFGSAHPFLWLISRLNGIRARFFGISFGDQGQFFRRSRLEAMGGYPDYMLMEDVELSYRLKGVGEPLYLGYGVVSSPRRWQTRPKLGHALLIVRLVLRYACLRAWRGPSIDVRPFYQAYYGRDAAPPAAPPES